MLDEAVWILHRAIGKGMNPMTVFPSFVNSRTEAVS